MKEDVQIIGLCIFAPQQQEGKPRVASPFCKAAKDTLLKSDTTWAEIPLNTPEC